MKFIQFQPNQPQSFVMPPTGPYKLPEENSAVIPLPGGDWLFLASPLASSLDALKLQPGEEFAICSLQAISEIPIGNAGITLGTRESPGGGGDGKARSGDRNFGRLSKWCRVERSASRGR